MSAAPPAVDVEPYSPFKRPDGKALWPMTPGAAPPHSPTKSERGTIGKQMSAGKLLAAGMTAPAKQTFSSKVIKEVNDWCDGSLLIPHEAIRIMLGYMEKGFLLDTVEKVGAFESLWKVWMYDFIHHHHDIEETMYMPWINKKVPNPPGLEIKKDHGALVADMDMITKVAEKKTLEAGKELEPMLAKFAKEMGEHLAQEEMFIPGMLRESGYTHEEEGEMIGQVMQSLSPEAFVTMLPLIFYAMDKAGGYGPLTSAVFFSTLPPPLQGAYPAFKEGFNKDFLAEANRLTEKPNILTPILNSISCLSARGKAK